MTLELNKVVQQIDQMGQVLAERTGRQRRALPTARELLHRFADQQDLLIHVAESEPGRRLRCASPGSDGPGGQATEPLDRALSVPACRVHQQTALIAVDGSQIYPDRHGLAFYYVLNIGSMVYRYGSGQAPAVATIPRLFFQEDDLYPHGEPISADLVGACRGLAEMQRLADLTVAEMPVSRCCVALTDGPLLIWLRRSAVPEDEQARILDAYLASLDRLRAAGAALAGFVSRPYSSEVVALLCLAELTTLSENGPVPQSLAESKYRGLTDRALFGFLEPGHRSALFVRGTAANNDFRGRGHTIYFFYLNTGADVARVEVPQWVAESSEHLDLIHAVVHDQCRLNNGYPYVLTRADEQAVILGEEREVLEAMIARAMARHGLDLPEPSRKAQQKQVARWRRGH